MFALVVRQLRMWLHPVFDAMLPELRSRPNWVLARATVRNGKLTKPPHQPDGSFANVSDPKTWSSFDQVKAAYLAGSFIGVGYVLDGKPNLDGKYLHGFDWDHCVVDGIVDPAVMERVNSLGISRVEKSISGTGLRGFFLHVEKQPSRKILIDGRSVELYSDVRYLTTTGLALPGMDSLS